MAWPLRRGSPERICSSFLTIRRAIAGSSFSSVFSAPAASRTIQAKALLHFHQRNRATGPAAKRLDGLVIVYLLEAIRDQPLYEPRHTDALSSRARLQGFDQRRIKLDGRHMAAILTRTRKSI